MHSHSIIVIHIKLVILIVKGFQRDYLWENSDEQILRTRSIYPKIKDNRYFIGGIEPICYWEENSCI